MGVYEAREERFGGYYEDYSVGDCFSHWPGKTITDSENHLFCLLTMATNPIHIDTNFVHQHAGEYDRPVVVGTYIYSLLLGMSMPDLSGRALANLGVEELRHTSPVFPGDTLYAESEILDTRLSRSRDDAGIITCRTWGKNQNGVVVAEFRRSILLPKRLT